MLSNEDIQIISNLLQPIREDIQEVKQHVVSLENRVEKLENRFEGLENRIEGLEQEVKNVVQRTTRIELILVCEISHNIQLLAENHIILIEKLNQSVEVADKHLLYDVQMSNFRSRLEFLEKEMIEIKNKIA